MKRSERVSSLVNDVFKPPSQGGILLPSKQELLLPENNPSFYSKLELDLEKSVSEVLTKDGAKVRPDIVINDGDFKQYPNFFEFCMDPNGLGFTPYARQMMMGIHLFGEHCPDCSEEEFIDRSLLGVPVDFPTKRLEDHVVFLKLGVCPRCKKDKLYFLKRGTLNFPQALVAVQGQRSGKSVMSAALTAYLIHRLLKLQNPLVHYDLAASGTLTGTFVAQNFESSMRLLWNPLKSIMAGSPFFCEYHKMLDYYVEKYDDPELFRDMGTFIRYRHRGLYLYPAAPSSQTLRGDTRIIGVMDELGWMDNTANTKVRNAEEVYTAIDRSLLTVRNAARKAMKDGYVNTPNGYAFAISSPSSAYDKMMTLKQAHQNSRRVYVCHLATWEVNPTITRKSLREEFRADPIKAERDYGANPPLSSSPFIEDLEAVKQCFLGKPNLVSYKYQTKKRQSGGLFKSAVLTNLTSRADIPASVLTLDAGSSNNSFALSVGHLEYQTDRVKVLPFGAYPEDEGLVPVCDALIEIFPDKGKSVINFTAVAENIIYPLIEACNVKLIASDRWQGIKFLHDIEDKYHIETVQYSLKYDDMLVVKSYIETSGFIFPKLERKVEIQDLFHIDLENYPAMFINQPAAHLLFQLMTVTDGPKNVEKGENLTDDLFRAIALLGNFLLDEEYRKILRSSIKKQRQAGAVGVALGLSGGTPITNQISALRLNNAASQGKSSAIGVVRSYKP